MQLDNKYLFFNLKLCNFTILLFNQFLFSYMVQIIGIPLYNASQHMFTIIIVTKWKQLFQYTKQLLVHWVAWMMGAWDNQLLHVLYIEIPAFIWSLLFTLPKSRTEILTCGLCHFFWSQRRVFSSRNHSTQLSNSTESLLWALFTWRPWIVMSWDSQLHSNT